MFVVQYITKLMSRRCLKTVIYYHFILNNCIIRPIETFHRDTLPYFVIIHFVMPFHLSTLCQLS